MRSRLTRLHPRRVALFVVVTTAVAVIAGFATREAGIGEAPATAAPSEQSVAETEVKPAAAEGEALSLSLTAPATCETERGQGYGRDEAVYDDEGNFLRAERKFVAWYGVQEFTVSWSVSGGTAPYTLTIDGETEDVNGAYAGASGRGRVLCADTTVETFIEPSGPVRGLLGDPKVDSGWKTVRAVVTDANGNTAEAMAQVYVILSTGDYEHPLRGGHTYRVFGHLLTVPRGMDLRIGEASTSGTVSLDVEGAMPPAWIVLDDETFREIDRVVAYHPDQVRDTEAENTDLDEKFDELVESFGKLPQRETNGGDR